MKYHCSKCKKEIPYVRGKCQECKQIEFEKKREKFMNRKMSKYRNTVEYGINQVRKYAEGQFWASAHENCFRCGMNETDEHIDTQFKLWKHHRRAGRTVFCNLRLKSNMGRPDLIILGKGFIYVIEVVKSEKEKSILAKKLKYPWPVHVVNSHYSR